MAAFLDVCRFTPTAGGTTDWTYSVAVTGYQSPAAAGVVNGRLYKYRAESADLSQWELGQGAYNTGTGVLARTTVLFNSSGTTSKISFSTVPQISVVALKEDLISIEEANSFTATQRAQARANAGAALNELGNVSFAVSAAAGALTIALKDLNGNDPTSATPISLTFRNATLTTGAQTVLEVTAASSVVVPSTSTLGTVNATACRLWITGWNDGGTFRLGVFNASTANNIFPLAEYGLGSSVQVVAAGNAAGQHYTAGAAVTSKAFRILGFVDWDSGGVATAGTWATTNLNSIQTFGPGIPRPGQVVQTAQVNSSTNTATSSTTFVSTNLTVNIIPTSAANLVRFAGTGVLDDSASGVVSYSQVFRGSTAVGPSCGGYSASGGETITACGWTGMDQPNTAASTTYVVKIKASVATTVTFLAGYTGTLLVDEIMG